ncbi:MULTISPECIES: DNA-directed RNA polymerase subunit omega [unclassified Butyrivibrio]|uniref:DNA-directed RNA polymerase subunit omega n=1 Tax=unclassified Butyrivibrio TaxID=2639466 RepID=UPI0003B733FC|nr:MULTISPECIES: DNA-directed RNA polymerase subunit omega [unclassified Butyrivibrio]MDC7295409.1 DNA-directed RNA polymerase subunit omega [Butyrivibrio sp. DSM 10294]
MIHPSYVDLMKVVNKGVEEGEEPVISSRYSVVMATAKRARQLIAGDEPMVRVKDKQKPLSIAVDEMNQDTLRILTDEERETLVTENEDVTVEESVEE